MSRFQEILKQPSFKRFYIHINLKVKNEICISCYQKSYEKVETKGENEWFNIRVRIEVCAVRNVLDQL